MDKKTPSQHIGNNLNSCLKPVAKTLQDPPIFLGESLEKPQILSYRHDMCVVKRRECFHQMLQITKKSL